MIPLSEHERIIAGLIATAMAFFILLTIVIEGGHASRGLALFVALLGCLSQMLVQRPWHETLFLWINGIALIIAAVTIILFSVGF